MPIDLRNDAFHADGSATSLSVQTPTDWLGILSTEIPVADVLSWVRSPRAGGIDCFIGSVRSHSNGREGVELLSYDAYVAGAEELLVSIAAEAHDRWPSVERLAMLHRVGELQVGQDAIIVAASAAHRDAAFQTVRWCVDRVKREAPIWKRETWRDGVNSSTQSEWVRCEHDTVRLTASTSAVEGQP